MQPDFDRHHVFTERILPIVLAVSVFAVFGHTCRFPILNGWDDNTYILNNAARLGFSFENIRHWFTTPCVCCYLPFTMVSYMTDHLIWGFNGTGYHLQNLLWHALTVIAIYQCFRILKISSISAALFAFFFAIHPQRVESVVWISERKDVMCGAFYFWSLYCYVRSRGDGGFPVLSFVLFVCAGLSKSMAVSLPFVMLCYEFHRYGRQFKFRRAFSVLLPFFAVSLVIIPIAAHFQSIAGGETSRARQFFVVLANLVWYPWRTVWPGDVCAIYPKISVDSALVSSLAVGYGVMAVLVVGAIRRNRDCAFYTLFPLLASYGLTIAPVSGIAALGYVDRADRYSYIASVFVLAGLAAGLDLLLRGISDNSEEAGPLFVFGTLSPARKRTLKWIIPMILLGYSGTLIPAAVLHAGSWRNVAALYGSAAAHVPPNPFALRTLGDIQLENGWFDSAVRTAELLDSNADSPGVSADTIQLNIRKAAYLRGVAFYRLGRIRKALPCLEKVRPFLGNTVFHEPTGNRAVYAMLADCYLSLGRTEEAMDCYEELLAVTRAGSFEAYFYRGIMLYHMGKFAQALESFISARSFKPEDKQLEVNIEYCRRELDRARP